MAELLDANDWNTHRRRMQQNSNYAPKLLQDAIPVTSPVTPAGLQPKAPGLLREFGEGALRGGSLGIFGEQQQGNDFLHKAAYAVGEFAGAAAPVALSALTGGAAAAPLAEVAATRLAGRGLAGLAAAAIRGAGTGAAYGALETGAQAVQHIRQPQTALAPTVGGAAGTVLKDAAMFGVGDAAFVALAPIVKRLLGSHAKNMTPEVVPSVHSAPAEPAAPTVATGPVQGPPVALLPAPKDSGYVTPTGLSRYLSDARRFYQDNPHLIQQAIEDDQRQAVEQFNEMARIIRPTFNRFMGATAYGFRPRNQMLPVEAARAAAAQYGFNYDAILARLGEAPKTEAQALDNLLARERLAIVAGAKQLPKDYLSKVQAGEGTRVTLHPPRAPKLPQLKDAVAAEPLKDGAGVLRDAFPAEGMSASSHVLQDAIVPSVQAEITPQTEQAALAKISTNRGKPKGVTEIIDGLEQAIGIPIRVGRFQQRVPGGRVLGIYKPGPEVARIGNVKNLPTAAHEAGHHIDKLLGLDFWVRRNGLQQAVLQFDDPKRLELYPPDQRVSEAIAEFFKAYVTDPAKIEQRAPKAGQMMEALLQQRAPKLLEALQSAREAYAEYKALAPEQRILTGISVGGNEQRAQAPLVERLQVSVDRYAPLRRFEEALFGKVPLAGTQSPYKLARLSEGSAGVASTWLYHAAIDPTTGDTLAPALGTILQPIAAKSNLDAFRAYLVARRVVDLNELHTPVEAADALQQIAQLVPDQAGVRTGFALKDAQLAVDRLEAAHPEFPKAADQLYRYQDALLQLQVRAGLLSEAGYKDIRRSNPTRVPFYRVFEDAQGRDAGTAAGRGFTRGSSLVKRFRGSERDIVDPLESIVRDTFSTLSAVQKQRVMHAVVKLADNATDKGHPGVGMWVERVDRAPHPQQDNVVTVMEHGEPHYYQLDPSLYRTLKGMDETSAGQLVKLLSYPARAVRTTATVLSPAFAVKNVARDQISAYIQSKYGFVPVVDFARGLMHAVRKDQLYWDWMSSGGAHAAVISVDRNYLQNELRSVLSGADKTRALNIIKNPAEMARAFNEFLEQATRLGEFEKAVRALGRSPDTLVDAALAAREVTLDFARGGNMTREINQVIPFFNAAIQGSEKLARTFAEDPRGATVRALAAITVPTVVLYLLNHTNPAYQELPQWEKDQYWIFPGLGGNLYRLPKPFEAGSIFGAIPERIIQSVLSKDPHAYDGLLAQIWQNGTPGWLPSAFQPWIEVMANHNFFTGNAIVSQSQESLYPYLQYDGDTPLVARELGAAVRPFNGGQGLSPKKVQHVIQAYGGSLARNAEQAVGAGLRAAGLAKEPPQATPVGADLPVVGTFLARTYKQGTSEDIDRFYKKLDAVTTAYESSKAQGLKPNPQVHAEYTALNRTSRAMSQVRKKIRRVQQSETLSPQQKRILIATYNTQLNNLARRAIGADAVPIGR